jgi:protein-S-isoprenylcysteine O-methyltransferase Ste14
MSRSWGKRLFRSRNILASLPLAFALFSTPEEWENGGLIWTAAIALCVAGIAIRAWARCHHNRGLRADRSLVRTGPYTYIRNPLYVGSILIIAGATVASRLVWLVPVSLLWSFAVYAAVAAYEEGRLVARHGADYERYRAEVPAWIPSLRAPSNAGSPSPFTSAIAIQSKKLLWLSPFILKELVLLKLLAR